jgi:hypothetical protein
MEFDGLDGRPAPPGYGVGIVERARILPTLEFDMANPIDGSRPVVLSLLPPTGADVAVVARDVAQLTAAVEAYQAGDKAALVEAWKRCLDDGFQVTRG